MKRVFAALWIVLALCSSAHAKLWIWSYSGDHISASGEFTTTDTSYGGGYTITGISGQRNGVAFTGLQPAGTAIPGNTGYPVDNLLSLSAPQLTGSGFGFSLADGTYSNPFFYSEYTEFFSVPANPAASTELPIAFSATPAPTPRPGQGFAGLALLALGVLALSLRRAARS